MAIYYQLITGETYDNGTGKKMHDCDAVLIENIELSKFSKDTLYSFLEIISNQTYAVAKMQGKAIFPDLFEGEYKDLDEKRTKFSQLIQSTTHETVAWETFTSYVPDNHADNWLGCHALYANAPQLSATFADNSRAGGTLVVNWSQGEGGSPLKTCVASISQGAQPAQLIELHNDQGFDGSMAIHLARVGGNNEIIVTIDGLMDNGVTRQSAYARLPPFQPPLVVLSHSQTASSDLQSPIFPQFDQGGRLYAEFTYKYSGKGQLRIYNSTGLRGADAQIEEAHDVDGPGEKKMTMVEIIPPRTPFTITANIRSPNGVNAVLISVKAMIWGQND